MAEAPGADTPKKRARQASKVVRLTELQDEAYLLAHYSSLAAKKRESSYMGARRPGSRRGGGVGSGGGGIVGRRADSGTSLPVFGGWGRGGETLLRPPNALNSPPTHHSIQECRRGSGKRARPRIHFHLPLAPDNPHPPVIRGLLEAASGPPTPISPPGGDPPARESTNPVLFTSLSTRGGRLTRGGRGGILWCRQCTHPPRQLTPREAPRAPRPRRVAAATPAGAATEGGGDAPSVLPRNGSLLPRGLGVPSSGVPLSRRRRVGSPPRTRRRARSGRVAGRERRGAESDRSRTSGGEATLISSKCPGREN